MGLPFAPGKEHIRLAQRFVGVGRVQEFLADSLVREEVAPLHVFCPYEIGDVVAHHPDEAVEVAELLVGPGEFALHALPLRDVAERDEACFPPFEEELRAEPFDPPIVPVQIPHQVVGEVAAVPGTHVLEVAGDGLRVVGVDELQRVSADEFDRRGEADERCGRGIGKQGGAVRVEDEDGIHEGVEGLQKFLELEGLLRTGAAGGDDTGDLRVREGGGGNRHGEKRAVAADQVGGIACDRLLPVDEPEKSLPLRLVRPYPGEGEGREFFRRVAEHAGEGAGGPGDAERSRIKGENTGRCIFFSVFRAPGRPVSLGHRFQRSILVPLYTSVYFLPAMSRPGTRRVFPAPAARCEGWHPGFFR